LVSQHHHGSLCVGMIVDWFQAQIGYTWSQSKSRHGMMGG